MILFVKTTKKNLQSPTDPEKTYAVAQSRQTLNIEDIAEHMANHNSNFSEGTIAAIITDLVSCMRELLLDGNSLHLGRLGNFNVTLKSRGVLESVVDRETGEKPVFTAADITGVNVNWTAGDRFAEMIGDATFEETVTKKVKAAQLKEKKEQLAAGTYDPNGTKAADEDHD